MMIFAYRIRSVVATAFRRLRLSMSMADWYYDAAIVEVIHRAMTVVSPLFRGRRRSRPTYRDF